MIYQLIDGNGEKICLLQVTISENKLKELKGKSDYVTAENHTKFGFDIVAHIEDIYHSEVSSKIVGADTDELCEQINSKLLDLGCTTERIFVEEIYL